MATETATPTATQAAAAEPAKGPAPSAPNETGARVQHHDAAAATAQVIPPPSAAPARTPMRVCSDCGVIVSIKPVKVEGKGSGVGAVAGGLAGLIIGNQIGGGSGKTIAKIAGAAGGAVLGNKIEKKARAASHYDITVRFDNGTEATVSQDQEPRLAIGAAVRVVDGAVIEK
jgi:outer membrane lipoprotein SlyB